MPRRPLWALLLVYACNGGEVDPDLPPLENGLPPPLAGTSAPPPAAATQLPAAAVDAPRPAGWPPDEGFAGSPESADYRCASDDHGNWVCALPFAGAPNRVNPGPCAFGPQGEIVTAWQALWSDLEASALITQFDSGGAVRWTRVWNRNGGYPTHTISAWDMRIHPDGRVVWAGRDCVRSSDRPAALDPGYYTGSCIDAYVATLDPEGELLWELGLGTRDGADSATDLALAPDGGVYVAGMYQPPFALPGLLQDGANGNIDFFVLALDHDGAPRWARRFGSPEHDGDRMSLAATPDGLAIHANLSQRAGPGLAAMLASDGDMRWLTQGLPHSIGDTVWLHGEVLVANGNELLVLNERGELQTRSIRDAPAPAWHLRVTAQGTLMLWSTGSPMREVTPAGQLLRQYDIGDAPNRWYYGGMCVSTGGAVAITSTVGPETRFDFLDTPFDLPLGAAFVMHLADWQGLSN